MTIYSTIFESHETLRMSTVPALTPAFWRGAGFMTTDRTADGKFADKLTFTTADVEFLAKAATEKGTHTKDGWSVYVPENCELFILDFEPWYGPDYSLFGLNFEAIYKWVKLFKSMAPNVKVAIYPFNLALSCGPSPNLDSITSPNYATLDFFRRSQIDISPLVDLIDVLAPDMYMTSTATWRRDIQRIHVMAAMFRRFNKPICPFVTPRFSGQFNKLTLTQCRAYWRTLSEACDGAVVWGLESDCNNLLGTIPK